MRIRIALSLGALLLAGGAVMGTALASAAEQPAAPPAAQPTQAPNPAPGEPATTPSRPGAQPPTVAPDGRPGVERNGRPATAPGAHRVPKAVPAGPVGDLHLPAIVEGAGN